MKVGILGSTRMSRDLLIAAIALEQSALMHIHECRDVELKPKSLDNYNRAGLPTLPETQTYVPTVNRKSKRW